MILFEVFRKRSRFLPLFQTCWERVSGAIVYPPVVLNDSERKLRYFGLIAYAAVYESAVAAGMSGSAAHYLARMQLKNFKLGKEVTKRVESTFSGCQNAAEQGCAELFLTRMRTLVAGEADAGAVLQELADAYEGNSPRSVSGKAHGPQAGNEKA